MLVTNHKEEDHAHPSKSKTFHEHFGEKWSQQWRERWGNALPWMIVLGIGGWREEEGGFCTKCITPPTHAASW
jgi:hypothetical protein